jgi:hypothetical protein
MAKRDSDLLKSHSVDEADHRHRRKQESLDEEEGG